MKKNQEYLIGILDTLLIVSIITLVILATPLIFAQFNSKPSNIEEIVNSCSDMPLLDSSTCTLGITNGFYKYNIENIGQALAFTELVEEGGVCSSWSEYYTELGKELGYNAENILIKIDEGLYHEFSVWGDENQYCVLDQTQSACFEFSTSG